MTWLRPSSGAYTVFFNRDEQRARALASPPREQVRAGLRFLAPTDGKAGGTWLAANEHGLTLALLNYYDAAPPQRLDAPRSRGHLIPALIDLADSASVTRRLETLAIAEFLPFILVAFDAAGPRAHVWDGRSFVWRELGSADQPWTTSAFASSMVVARRVATFRQMCGASPVEKDLLDQFHRHQDPADGASSVWMSRPDAQTVSFSRVSVTPAHVEFLYEPRADGRVSGPVVTTEMPRS